MLLNHFRGPTVGSGMKFTEGSLLKPENEYQIYWTVSPYKPNTKSEHLKLNKNHLSTSNCTTPKLYFLLTDSFTG